MRAPAGPRHASRRFRCGAAGRCRSRNDALLTLLASPTIASKALDLSPVRPHGADEHRRARRPRRRGRAGQGHGARAGDVGRRQRPVLLPRSASGRAAGRGRGRTQRRLRRRRCHRRDQLPEFRQSRAAGDHVAVGGGRRRHRRGLPGARRADHRRQRQPLQRDRRQRHPADAGHRRGRRPRGRARRC